MTTKIAILFICIFAFGNVCLATEIKVNDFSKLDSLVSVHNKTVSVGDSTISSNKPYQKSAIVGFSASVLAIFSWIFQLTGNFGILAIFFNPAILGIVGLVFSIIAILKIKKSGNKGKKLAKAGIILTIIHALGLIGLLVLVLLALSNFS